MASAKLHIEGADARPDVIKHYLDFIDRRDYDDLDTVMQDIYRETGLDVADTKNMLTTLAKLGIVKQGNRQQLTDLGDGLVEVLLYNDQLFYELFHFIYSVAYYRDRSPNRSISWSYYHISADLRSRAPVNFSDVRQSVVESVMQQADESTDEALEDHGPLSRGSLNNYQRFIERLEPKVFEDGEFTLRTFAKKELVLAAIDHLYRTSIVSDTVDYGDPLPLDDDSEEVLSNILIVQQESLTDIIEHVASMDSRLGLESDYQLRVRLSDPVELNDLA